MPEDTDCNLFLYVYDTCFLYQHKDKKKKKKKSNSLKKKGISYQHVFSWQDLMNVVTMLSQPYIILNT